MSPMTNYIERLAAKITGIAAAALVLTATASAQQPGGNLQTVANLQTINVRGGIYMIAGDGANVTVQTGSEGVLVINTGVGPLAPALMSEIRKIAKGPIRYIINTSAHADCVSGNEALSKLIPANRTQPLLIIAQANVLNRLTVPPADNPIPVLPGGLPTDEYELPFKDLHYNGEAVIIYHEPHALTDGDSTILFRGTDVLSTGEIYDPEGYPYIDLERSGSVEGEIEALDHLLDLAVPEARQEGGTLIIPGHGRISEEADLVEYRDMVVIVKDRVKAYIKKGMTLDQIKASKPTLDYDTQYIAKNSKISGDAFVETIYKSLSKQK